MRAFAAPPDEALSHDCLSFFQHNSCIFCYSSVNGQARKIAGYGALVISMSEINNFNLKPLCGLLLAVNNCRVKAVIHILFKTIGL